MTRYWNLKVRGGDGGMNERFFGTSEDIKFEEEETKPSNTKQSKDISTGKTDR
jgi:hypothetical protein